MSDRRKIKDENESEIFALLEPLRRYGKKRDRVEFASAMNAFSERFFGMELPLGREMAKLMNIDNHQLFSAGGFLVGQGFVVEHAELNLIEMRATDKGKEELQRIQEDIKRSFRVKSSFESKGDKTIVWTLEPLKRSRKG